MNPTTPSCLSSPADAAATRSTSLSAVKDSRPADGGTWWGQLGYYLIVILPIVIYVAPMFINWGDEKFAPGRVEPISNWLRLIAIAQLPVLSYQFGLCLVCLFGIVYFGAPRDQRPSDHWSWDPDVRLIVAYVSRGSQPSTLSQASGITQRCLEKYGVKYAIEVVTDIEIPFEFRLAPGNGDVLYYFVPSTYQTKRGARFKARALQYLLEKRTERLGGRETVDNVWVLHMDEESILTPECIFGISEHIKKYDLRHTPGAIGQGEILYNSQCYGEHAVVTTTDAIRTSQDLGLFRLAFKCHYPLIGMHGSYVLTPAIIEQQITWDVGGPGSVTEDAYFALLAMQNGIQFDWVNGFIREQSPFTIMDVVRQRRRWFCGLRLVAFDSNLHLKTTYFLRFAVLFWTLGALASPLPFIYIFLRVWYGTTFLPYGVFEAGIICCGMYGSQYGLGAYRNLLHYNASFPRKCWIALSSMFIWLCNFPSLVESAGVVYGLFSPVTTFYVVAKDSERRNKKETIPLGATEKELEGATVNC